MNYGEFLERLTFSQKGKDLFFEIHRMADDKPFSDMLALARSSYNDGDEAFGKYIADFSRQSSICPEQLTFYTYILFAEKTLERYRALGINEDIFYDSFASLARNCERTDELYGIYGIQQKTYRNWYRLDLDFLLFRLGRLEFELCKSPYDMPEFEIKKGDAVIGVHIPKGKNLLTGDCEDAYDRARSFFKKYFDIEKCTFTCESWLLHPWLKEVLPETAAIIRFQNAFKIIDVKTDYQLVKNWIFPGCEKKSLDELPQETTLQRAAVRRMKNGDSAGYAFGVRL